MGAAENIVAKYRGGIVYLYSRRMVAGGRA